MPVISAIGQERRLQRVSSHPLQQTVRRSLRRVAIPPHMDYRCRRWRENGCVHGFVGLSGLRVLEKNPDRRRAFVDKPLWAGWNTRLPPPGQALPPLARTQVTIGLYWSPNGRDQIAISVIGMSCVATRHDGLDPVSFNCFSRLLLLRSISKDWGLATSFTHSVTAVSNNSAVSGSRNSSSRRHLSQRYRIRL